MKDTYPNNLMERIIRLEESSEQFKDDIGDLKKDIKEVKSELCLWFKRVDTSVQELKFAQTRMSEIQFNNFIIGGKMPKICLDAGHNNSGIDTGTHGNGLREELLTLDICQLIKPLLQFNGFEVVMTREGDFVNGPHGTVNESL
jgi:N-acetylmuramoyl-L-alanine amidase